MSWGIEEWGHDVWGGVAAGLTIQAALAVSERDVQVTLTEPPLQRSPVGQGDALNPATWRVSRGSRDFHVLTVTRDDVAQFTLRTLYVFDSSLFAHLVVADALRADDESLADPLAKPFSGCAFSPFAAPGSGLIDIANPQFGDGHSPGGVLLVGAGGDYKDEGGADLLRKLIIRRLITTPGGFFHLPRYGVGISAKSPLLVSDLVTLRLEIERQISEEPEVSEVGVRLQLSVQGALTVVVKARMRGSNQLVEASVSVSQEGVA